MIQSMTGYGAAEHEGIKVEVRSLNHKFAEVSLRMPSLFAEHDIALRRLVKEKFARGKFDISVTITEKRQTEVSVNKEFARNIYNAFVELQKELSLPGTITIDLFSGYRDLLLTEEQEISGEVLIKTFQEALAKLEEMRKTEGEALKKEIRALLGKIDKNRGEIEGFAGGVIAACKEKLQKRLAEVVPNLPFDEVRLAQEVAMLAQRSDITEELARLKSHVAQFDTLLSNGGVVGRKLDFMLQELNRETNTIASKADDPEIINRTIEMKTEIEKIREQVQNIQ